MNLITSVWLQGVSSKEDRAAISPLDITGDWIDISSPRPDFRGAIYQLLIGILQLSMTPEDEDEWKELYQDPPSRDDLAKAFSPYQNAFELEADGPAFMQDLLLLKTAALEPNQNSVRDLLIDAGSDSNLYFNKHKEDFALCESCFAQALFTLQINAPSGGRGIRTSLRGGGPITTLVVPVDESPEKPSTLWQKLWLNVLPKEALNDSYSDIKKIGDVLPWMVATRTSDGSDGVETTPESAHPLQAYWSMPRRIRIDTSSIDGHGNCSICAAKDVRTIRHYLTRHGGTNYTGNWLHPLTPYSLDSKGEKPPISIKGRQAGKGYREWLGLVLGNDDHQPDAAKVTRHFNEKRSRKEGRKGYRLWCFGYDMSNMKAMCWYDSALPIHELDARKRLTFIGRVKDVLDSAEGMAYALHKQVKSAWFNRPGDAGSEPAVFDSFWETTEPLFYNALNGLSDLYGTKDEADEAGKLTVVYKAWLNETRRAVLRLFDHWVLSAPIEEQNMKRVVEARADLGKELNLGKQLKPLWDIVDPNRGKKTKAKGKSKS
ncbi:type I-E CRISPR-associated protein Cse1/CasA [Lautropia mirabilis]